jgi:plastocyanin
MGAMRRAASALVLLASLAVLAGCGGAATNSGAVPAVTTTPQTTPGGTALVGTVGPGYTIELKQGSTDVTAMKAGTYTLTVTDAAAMHDFALQAPDGTVTQITDLPFVGTKSATVSLTPGTWTYFCQPHSTQMRGSFTVS